MFPSKTARVPRCTAVFFVLAFIVFTCVFPYNHAVNNPNENVRTYMTMAIVENHTFKIDAIVQRHGWVNDMAAAPDKVTGERHLYSVKAPAVSYMGVPFYWAFTKLAPRWHHAIPTMESTIDERVWWFRATTIIVRLFAIQIPCFLFLVWLERWLRGVTSDAVIRLSAVAATGFGTNYLAYSLMFCSHALFAVAAFASFAIATRERQLHPLAAKRRRLSRAFLAGFFAGFATLLEYHALPVSVCLAFWAFTVFYRPTRLAMMALGGLINVAALMFFQWRAFNDPFMPGHKMSENPLFAQLLNQGYFGIGKPSWDVAKDITFDLGFGFLGTSPFMWLGLLAIPFTLIAGFGTRREQWQRRWATFAWLVTMAVLWTTVSAAINWRGGWTVGPRYLGAAPPFFAYGAVCALEAISFRAPARRTLMRGVAGGLAVASVLSIGVVGMFFNTIPEDIVRPLAHFAWPMIRAGFVPHHALELFGVTSPIFWYVVLGCMIGATLLVALWPWRDRVSTWLARVAIFAIVLFAGMKPALSQPEPVADEGGHVRHGFAQFWEPPGRDRIATLRKAAEQFGPRRPCLWHKVATLERLMDMKYEADRDDKKSPIPPDQCH
jgi:hypothetical protein